jgi:type III restriction enzyme
LQSPGVPHHKTPSELGELFRIPLLAYRQGDFWEPFEETHLLQGEWRLLDYPAELTESEFKRPERSSQGGRFLLKESEIRFEYFDQIEQQLALFEYQSGWNHADLVDWLARNIHDDSLVPDEKAAFLNRAVTFLLEDRGMSLEDLTYARFRFRAALEAKIKDAKRAAMRTVHTTLLALPDMFSADSDSCEMIFRQGRYAYDRHYQGFVELPKHFFPHIGNLAAEGEEFECAVFLATQLEGVKYWVRNVERKPTSFSLQTASDRFYPDFVCQMEDGRVLVVEYKNSRDWDLPDNIEKRQLGELWQRRSNGKGLFTMPRGKDWAAIRAKLV